MKKKTKNIILSLVSSAAGFCNALLGAGGGILLSLTLTKLCSNEFEDRRDVYINSQASMIPGCALSCAIYSLNGRLDTTGFSIYAIPAVIGGIVGSLLLSRIKSFWIGLIFAVLVIWSGIKMILG